MPIDQPIVFATSNAHKLDEVRGVFAPAGVAVEGLDALDRPIDEPVEDQPTFAANAALKARYYAARTGRTCLADDSGLMVDALDGAPGVLSARYAGVSGPRGEIDRANNRKLLDALADVPEDQRTARFICAMALSAGEQIIAEVTGEVRGRILTEPRGENGFGYDPLFFMAALGRSAAELAPDQKNAISHRGAAARRMIEAIGRL